MTKKKIKKRVTKFRVFCLKEGITQQEIHDNTKLSKGCISNMWNEGKASGATIKLVSLVFKLNENELTKMVKTFDKN